MAKLKSKPQPNSNKVDGFKKKSFGLKQKSNSHLGKKEDGPKPSLPPKSENPFEVKINKQKFQILGRPTKHERGLPGVSRAKALKKRQETLLQEYKTKHKSNKLIDKRLGEKDPTLSVEGKMELRFLAEKIKNSNKKSKFILGDDEVLTHRGQTLTDIEKFDDPRSDSDEEEERLGKSFVSDAHFGGGFLKKSEETEEALLNRESLIDNLIAESKKRKEERQKEREETDELTDKLDEDYRNMLDVLAGIRNPKKSDATPAKLPDSAYDVLVRELRFDPRVKPGDKLKSAEEIARQEKEKLEKLEADRLRRMKGDLGRSKVIPHRSADDLDDGFTYNYEQKVKPLSFGLDGAINQDEADEGDPEKETADENTSDGEEGDEEDGSEEDEDEEDSYSDLDSGDENENGQIDKSNGRSKPSVEKKLSKRIAGVTEMRTDIPFVFEVPEDYDEFYKILQAYSEKDHKTVLERIIKSNHPALHGGNKVKAEKIFTFLLQYIHDLALSDNAKLLDDLAPVAFDLSLILPSNQVANIVLDVLLEKREELSSAKKKQPISLPTVIFLKLTSLLFPTSDFRHPVTTPAFHLLLEALASPITNLQSLHIGLIVCSIAFEYVSFSRRYVPEAIHFLRGLLELAIPRPENVPAPSLVYPFRPVGPESQLLVLTGDDTRNIDGCHLKLNQVEFDDSFRIAAIHIAVRLLSDFIEIWSELPAVTEIYTPILESLENLPLKSYNTTLQEAICSLKERIGKACGKTKKRLIYEAKKPKPLRLYEPAVEQYFDGRKKRVGSKEKLERDKLKHKLKREMKGAIREIRKDNAFLARQQLNEQIERDVERKRKVKELLSSLAMQEGEVRKIKKTKK